MGISLRVIFGIMVLVNCHIQQPTDTRFLLTAILLGVTHSAHKLVWVESFLAIKLVRYFALQFRYSTQISQWRVSF